MLSENLSGSLGPCQSLVSFSRAQDKASSAFFLMTHVCLSPADGLQSLTMTYRDSFNLTVALLETLLTFPPLPTPPPDQTSKPSSTLVEETVPSATTTQIVKDTEPQPSIEQLLSFSPSKKPGKRPSNESVQASMSLLACQPLLPGKDRDSMLSSEGWEDVMSVEIGGYAQV